MEAEFAKVRAAWMLDPRFNRTQMAKSLGVTTRTVQKWLAEIETMDPATVVEAVRVRQVELVEQAIRRGLRELTDDASAVTAAQASKIVAEQLKSLGFDAPDRSIVARVDADTAAAKFTGRVLDEGEITDEGDDGV